MQGRSLRFKIRQRKGSRLASEGESCRPDINHRKSICVSRTLSMKQAAKVMHICSVIIYPLEKKIIGTAAVIFHLAGRQHRQYVSPLNIIYNAVSYFRTYFLHTIECSSDLDYCHNFLSKSSVHTGI